MILPASPSLAPVLLADDQLTHGHPQDGSSSLPHCPVASAAALSVSQAAYSSPSSHHSSSATFARRVCVSSGCKRVLWSVHNDPCTICVACCGSLCDVDSRCAECASWNPTHLFQACKYQLTLQQDREYKAKERTPMSASRDCGGWDQSLPVSIFACYCTVP